ncbi:hypothetical protein GCM10009780_30420 [Actinomadura alba]
MHGRPTISLGQMFPRRAALSSATGGRGRDCAGGQHVQPDAEQGDRVFVPGGVEPWRSAMEITYPISEVS